MTVGWWADTSTAMLPRNGVGTYKKQTCEYFRAVHVHIIYKFQFLPTQKQEENVR